MGTTSTTTHRDLAVIQAEYDALPKKTTSKAYALRQELKAARDAQVAAHDPAFLPSPTAIKQAVEVSEILAPDLTAGGLLSEATAVYWCGIITFSEPDEDHPDRPTRPHPPFHSTTLAGVTFASWFTPWEDGRPEEEGSQRGHYPGMLVSISESTVALLKNRLKRTLIRWRLRSGRHAHGHQVTMIGDAEIEEIKDLHALDKKQLLALRQKHRGFQVLEHDEALASYIYCQKVPGATAGSSWRPSPHIPDSVLVTGIESP